MGSGHAFGALLMMAGSFASACTMSAAPATALSPTDYLKQVLTARVYDVAVESDLTPAKVLGRRLHNKVLLKREDQQPVFSF